MAIGGIPIDEFSGAGATKDLHKTLVDFNKQSAKQTDHMLYLTYAMLVLGIASLVASCVQIWLAMQPRT